MTEFICKAEGLTDVGLARDHNEDSMLLLNEQQFWLVADGMGGHENGALASQTAVSGFKALSLSPSFDDATQAVTNRMHAVNSRLVHMVEGQGKGQMGTTAVALLIRDGNFSIAWVGDSRAYIYRRGGLFQITVDHTHVQDLVDDGLLSAEEAEAHPMGHVLTRALGVQSDIQVDVVQDTIEHGDIFLLCSDGLTGPVSNDDIRAIIANNSVEDAASALIKAAHDGGAPDNVTAILVAIEGEQA